jgi:hypothetical protein
MTFDRKIVVGIEDIKSISLECAKCGVRLVISPDNVGVVPCECPNQTCRNEWAPQQYQRANPHGPAESKIPVQIKLIEAIAGVRMKTENNKVENPGKSIGFKIFLEFADSN